MASKWTTVAFGEIARLEQGLCFNKKTNHLMAETGIPLLRIVDLINNTQTKFVDEEGVPRKFIAKPQDIIYSRTGQVGLVFKGKVGVVHNNCFRVIPQDGIERDYVYWYLKQPSLFQQARSLASGAAQPDLGHDAFKSILFSYPEQETQRKIAAMLTAYDDLIESNLRRIKILREMAQNLYCEWFINFQFPMRKTVELIDSPLGLIPEGWKVQKLKDVAGINSKSIKKTFPHSMIEYIDIASVKEGHLKNTSTHTLEEAPSRARRLVAQGDTIWSTVRPNRKSYLYIHKPSSNLVVSTGFAVLTPQDVPPSYIYFTVTRSEFVDYLSSNVVGSAYPAVRADRFADASIIIPPRELLQRFESFANPLLSLVSEYDKQSRALSAIRDLLLPKLMSGEVDVSLIEITTPTEVKA